MARTKGMLNLSGNLEVNAGAPLDARTVVPTVADLTVAANFQYKYVGMTVVVQATGDMYVLTANDVTVVANWKQVGSGGGGSSYTAGDGIDISNDEISVKAGSNLSFDSSGNLNATDTKYTAGTNVSISNQNVISATDTTYTAGTGIDITNNVISATGGGGTSYTAGDGIDITNNVISVDEMASADMAEIVTPLPSVMSRLPRYTTEEQIVAYWIDGKPLYQRVVQNTSGPAGPWKLVVDLPTTCVIVKCECYLALSDNLSISAGYSNGAIFDIIFNSNTSNQAENGKVIVYVSDASFASKPLTSIVLYTKTTDTPA